MAGLTLKVRKGFVRGGLACALSILLSSTFALVLPQSWYRTGLHRIEGLSRHEMKSDDKLVVAYPIALELDLERGETTLWLYVGSGEKRGKKGYFCPRGATLRDGVSDKRLPLTRLEAATVVTRKGRGECLELVSKGRGAAEEARIVFDVMGEAQLKGERPRQVLPGQVGLVFVGLPSRNASYLAVELPIGEEFLFFTRDLH